jgi:hypothetical protein
MIDQYTFDAAPYVLGALSEDEQRAFEEHMLDCVVCSSEVREFSELPALLAQLPPDDPALTMTDEQLEPPATLLPSLLFTVRRERRKRRWRVATAIGLAAACLAGLGTVVVLQRATGPAPASVAQALAFRPVGDVPVRATATLTPKAWGTEIHVTCTYTGQPWEGRTPRTYSLVPVDKAGKEHAPISDWAVRPDQEVQMTGSTALTRDQLGELEIRNAAGRTILELPL